MADDVAERLSATEPATPQGTDIPSWRVTMPSDPDAAADLLGRVFDRAYLEALAEWILRRLAEAVGPATVQEAVSGHQAPAQRSGTDTQ